jgi:hypothetical protein
LTRLSSGQDETPDGGVGWRESGLLLRLCRLRRASLLHFDLAAQNRTPVFVFGNGHSALDADASSCLGRVGFSQQAVEQ